jgi:polyhydroxyalkanoate synthesis regulator protein
MADSLASLRLEQEEQDQQSEVSLDFNRHVTLRGIYPQFDVNRHLIGPYYQALDSMYPSYYQLCLCHSIENFETVYQSFGDTINSLIRPTSLFLNHRAVNGLQEHMIRINAEFFVDCLEHYSMKENIPNIMYNSRISIINENINSNIIRFNNTYEIQEPSELVKEKLELNVPFLFNWAAIINDMEINEPVRNLHRRFYNGF